MIKIHFINKMNSLFQYIKNIIFPRLLLLLQIVKATANQYLSLLTY